MYQPSIKLNQSYFQNWEIVICLVSNRPLLLIQLIFVFIFQFPLQHTKQYIITSPPKPQLKRQHLVVELVPTNCDPFNDDKDDIFIEHANKEDDNNNIKY